MKKIILIIILLSLQSPNVLGQQNVPDKKVIQGSKDLPLEMNLLISSLQDFAPEKYEKIHESILVFDRYARSINKEDLFLIGKIEIYRTFLKNSDLPKQLVDGESLKTLRASLEKTKDPFSKWFLNSLIQDTAALIVNPVFKEYQLRQNATGLEISKYRRVLKKSQLLQSWAQKLNPQLEDFDQTLRDLMVPKMEAALKNIENSFYFMASYARLGPLAAPITDDKELKFFSIKTKEIRTAPKKAQPTKEKTVDDILGPLTNESPVVLPLPSEESWLEEENTPDGLKILPKPSNDADWLEDI